MKIRALFLTIVVTAALACATPASADDLRVLSSIGIRTVVEDLAPKFENMTKHKVTMVFDLSSTVKAKIEGGEPFDVVIITPAQVDDLAAKGHVSAASKTVVARVGLGLMIKSGARKPDMSSVEAFKKTLLAAKSISYATTGASGVAFVATAKQLGIFDALKLKPAATGDEINANVLSGVSDLAVLPLSEILPVKGAELGGMFPQEVQTTVVMAAGVNATARGSAAKDFIAFLMSPANTAVVKTKGMER